MSLALLSLFACLFMVVVVRLIGNQTGARAAAPARRIACRRRASGAGRRASVGPCAQAAGGGFEGKSGRCPSPLRSGRGRQRPIFLGASSPQWLPGPFAVPASRRCVSNARQARSTNLRRGPGGIRPAALSRGIRRCSGAASASPAAGQCLADGAISARDPPARRQDRAPSAETDRPGLAKRLDLSTILLPLT